MSRPIKLQKTSIDQNRPVPHAEQRPTHSSQRKCKPSKKRRIILRSRFRASVASASAKEATEAEEREKRTRRNREKKVKRKKREKKKKANQSQEHIHGQQEGKSEDKVGSGSGQSVNRDQ